MRVSARVVGETAEAGHRCDGSGVGRWIDVQQLHSVASYPTSRSVIIRRNVADDDVVLARQLHSLVCNGTSLSTASRSKVNQTGLNDVWMMSQISQKKHHEMLKVSEQKRNLSPHLIKSSLEMY